MSRPQRYFRCGQRNRAQISVTSTSSTFIFRSAQDKIHGGTAFVSMSIRHLIVRIKSRGLNRAFVRADSMRLPPQKIRYSKPPHRRNAEGKMNTVRTHTYIHKQAHADTYKARIIDFPPESPWRRCPRRTHIESTCIRWGEEGRWYPAFWTTHPGSPYPGLLEIERIPSLAPNATICHSKREISSTSLEIVRAKF